VRSASCSGEIQFLGDGHEVSQMQHFRAASPIHHERSRAVRAPPQRDPAGPEPPAELRDRGRRARPDAYVCWLKHTFELAPAEDPAALYDGGAGSVGF
jgi:hypothetical protein